MLSVVVLIVVMLRVIMLILDMLNVVMLSVKMVGVVVNGKLIIQISPWWGQSLTVNSPIS